VTHQPLDRRQRDALPGQLVSEAPPGNSTLSWPEATPRAASPRAVAASSVATSTGCCGGSRSRSGRSERRQPDLTCSGGTGREQVAERRRFYK